MKQRKTLFIALLSLMLLATSFCVYAAQQGQVIASGSVLLERESEASNKLNIEADTESHVDADLYLKISLDYKSSENASYTTVKTWTYTKDSDTLLAKNTSYTGADGFYRVRAYHTATLSGYGTEALSSETDWLEVK